MKFKLVFQTWMWHIYNWILWTFSLGPAGIMKQQETGLILMSKALWLLPPTGTKSTPFRNLASKVAGWQVHATTPGAIQKQFKAVQTKLEQFKAVPTFTAI